MSAALENLEVLNEILKKLGLPNAQDLRGRAYCFTTTVEENKNVEVFVEVGTIGRIVYDRYNEEIRLIPDAYSRSAYDTSRIEILVDPDPKSQERFGMTYMVCRTTDDLSVEINSEAHMLIDFKIL